MRFFNNPDETRWELTLLPCGKCMFSFFSQLVRRQINNHIREMDEQSKTTPSVYIFSDAIKQAMEGFAVAHRDSMAAMAEKNSEALAAAVGRIAETLTSRVGHPSQDLHSPGLSFSAHTLLKVADFRQDAAAQAHAAPAASCSALTGKKRLRGGGGGGGTY